jgi:hypothetical protein
MSDQRSRLSQVISVRHRRSRGRTYLQGTLAILSLYALIAFSFSSSPSFQNLEDGVMNLELVRHIGHFLVLPDSTISPAFPAGSRH